MINNILLLAAFLFAILGLGCIYAAMDWAITAIIDYRSFRRSTAIMSEWK